MKQLIALFVAVLLAVLFFINTDSAPGLHSGATQEQETPSDNSKTSARSGVRASTPKRHELAANKSRNDTTIRTVLVTITSRSTSIEGLELYLFDPNKDQPTDAKSIEDLKSVPNGYSILMDLRPGQIITTWSRTTMTTAAIYKGGKALTLPLRPARQLIVRHLNIPKHRVSVSLELIGSVRGGRSDKEIMLRCLRRTDRETLFRSDIDGWGLRESAPRLVEDTAMFVIRSGYSKWVQLIYNDLEFANEWRPILMFTKKIHCKHNELTIDFGKEDSIHKGTLVLIGSKSLAGRPFWLKNLAPIPNRPRLFPNSKQQLKTIVVLDGLRRKMGLQYDTLDESGERRLHIETIDKPIRLPETKTVVIRRNPRRTAEAEVEFGLRKLGWGFEIAMTKIPKGAIQHVVRDIPDVSCLVIYQDLHYELPLGATTITLRDTSEQKQVAGAGKTHSAVESPKPLKLVITATQPLASMSHLIRIGEEEVFANGSPIIAGKTTRLELRVQSLKNIPAEAEIQVSVSFWKNRVGTLTVNQARKP